MRGRLVMSSVVTIVAVIGGLSALQSRAFVSGDGKGSAADDCLIGLDGVDAGFVVPFKGKPAVQCTDCDPACDADGVSTADGSCTFRPAVCVNRSDVDGCTPEAVTKASVKPKSLGLAAPSPLPTDASYACGATGSVVVKTKKGGTKPGKRVVRLRASTGGSPKRTDPDAMTLVCNPRPVGEACPSGGTTTTVPGGSTTTSTEPGGTTTTSSSTSSSSTSSTSTTTIPSCSPNCTPGAQCLDGSNCASSFCFNNVCKCPGKSYTFSMSSNLGGSLDPAEWPGGTASQFDSTGCSVQISRPSGNIDGAGDAFQISGTGGYSNCTLNSCQTTDCPPAGIGACNGNRPTCSAALNGAAVAQIVAACSQ